MSGKDAGIKKWFNEKEFDVLDEVYFVTPYDQVKENLGITSSMLDNALRNLLKNNFIKQLYFSNGQKDYIEKDKADLKHLEKYAYLASKEGLLAHNT